MPGLIGFTRNCRSEPNNAMLDKITSILCNNNHHNIRKRIISNIYNGLVAFNIDRDTRECESDHYYICIYGDVIIENSSGKEARQILFDKICTYFPEVSFFSDVDGLFNILIYDKRNNDLYLVNDRNDNDFQDYLFALPDGLDLKRLYYKMLLTGYPCYFNSIPQLKTGETLCAYKNRLSFHDKIKYIRKKIGPYPRVSYSKYYHDYNNWFRNGAGFVLLNNTLVNNKNCLLSDFIPYELITKKIQEQMCGSNNAESLSRFITLEYMLQNTQDHVTGYN